MKTMERVLEPGKTFWVISDRERFLGDGNTPPEVRAFLLARFMLRWKAADESIAVYSWTVPAQESLPSASGAQS